MDYSALNPVAWGAFAVFAVVVWAVVRIYKTKHPGYPGGWPDEEKQGTRDTGAAAD